VAARHPAEKSVTNSKEARTLRRESGLDMGKLLGRFGSATIVGCDGGEKDTQDKRIYFFRHCIKLPFTGAQSIYEQQPKPRAFPVPCSLIPVPCFLYPPHPPFFYFQKFADYINIH
jgi:hypothetical protein